MLTSHAGCNESALRMLLDGSLGPSDEQSVQAHLEQCGDCRRHLEAIAVGDLPLENDYPLLVDDELDREVAQSAGNVEQDTAEHIEDETSVATVLKQLAPTDDPQMFGRIGCHEVSGVVGVGAMGVVLKAYDNSLDRTVAIKVLAPHLASSGASRQRFAREAKAAAAVLHPNVMAIHSVSQDEPLPYLVMPYLRGASLQKRIDNEGPLPTSEILRIASQIAAGLAAAHSQGLVHRDIKPSNILLEEGVERVAITDFGLARTVDDASMTRTGVIVGTPQYMSPEQARGELIDLRSDLFSLGSVLYAMCAGRPPFRAETSYGVLRRITDDEPHAIRDINPDIPDWLAAIIAKLMSKRPDGRFESAQEVAELLEECLAHVQQPTTTPLPKSVKQLPTSLTAGKQNQPDRVSGRFGRKPWANALRLIAVAAVVFAMVFAGILIVLELNKGTLTIESEVDDVPIKIMQGDEVVEKLTVTKVGKSVRVAAGQYVVEIGGEFDGLMVKDETVNLRRGGREVVRIVKRPRQENPEQRAPATEQRAPAAPNAELRRLQGVWMVNTCDSATKGFGDKLAVVRDWRWDVRGNEITWARSHGKVWKMSFTIDPTKAPKEIDLTFLDGPFKGKKSLGRYRWGGADGKTLWISVQDPGVDVPRPKSIGMTSGETSLILLDRPDADRELASLQGKWKLEIFYTDTLPKPTGNYVGREWVIKGNEMSWTGPNGAQIRMSFTIDPTKLPHEIDATFRSGPLLSGKCLGMYRRRGDTLWLCFADPGSDVPRPKNVAYETLSGKTMIGVSRADDDSKKVEAPKKEIAPAAVDRSPTSRREPLTLKLKDSARMFRHDTLVRGVSYSNDGRRIASSGNDGIVRIWDATNGKQVFAPKAYRIAVAAVVRFSRDGKWFASGAGTTVIIWNATTGKQFRSMRIANNSNIRDIAFSADGKRVASVGVHDENVNVWDIDSGKLAFSVTVPSEWQWIDSVAFSRDGKWLAAGSYYGGSVQVCDANTGRESRIIKTRKFGSVRGLAFSPDSKQLAAAGGGTVVWDVATWQQTARFKQPSGLFDVSFSPDGKRLAVCGSSALAEWDLASGRQTLSRKSGNDMYALAYRPDGKQLAVGGGNVRLWDLPSRPQAAADDSERKKDPGAVDCSRSGKERTNPAEKTRLGRHDPCGSGQR